MPEIELHFEGAESHLSKGQLIERLKSEPTAKRIIQVGDAAVGTFAELTQTRTEATFHIDQDSKWSLGGQTSLAFKLNAGLSGKVVATREGQLFGYKSDEDAPEVAVAANANQAYISLILNGYFDLDGNAESSGPNGFGVTAEFGVGRAITYEMHRAFPPTALIREAILDTFENLVLPFQSTDVNTLRSGDYLRWDFIGNLKLGAGVEWGFNQLLVGGNSPAEITSSLNNDLTAKLTVTAQPEIALHTSLAVTYAHRDRFQILLGHTGTDLSLLLFTMDKTDIGVTLEAKATFDPGTTLDFDSSLDSIVKDKLLSRVNFPGKDLAAGKLQDKLNSVDGQQQVQKLVSDTNDAIASWKKSTQLRISADRIQRKVAFYHYHFDLNQSGALETGFPLAMNGKWDEALRVPGVSMEPGTILEREFVRSTAISFHFFDLFQFSDLSQYFEKTKLIYTGDQTFRLQLESDIGFKGDSGRVGHAGHVEFYFSAVVSTNNLKDVANAAVNLHCRLLDHSNRAKALQTAAMLANIGPVTLDLGNRLHQLVLADPALDVRIEFKIASSAFGSIPVSSLHGLHTEDQASWNAFVQAVNVVLQGSGSPLRFPTVVASFTKFEQLQSFAIDQMNGPADRRQKGNPGRIPPSEYNNNLIALNWMETAREFLNLCDDLNQLTKSVSLIQTNAQYAAFVDTLKAIANEDTPGVWFTKPMMLALLQRMGLSSWKIQRAPDPLLPVGREFAATFEVS